jgi:flagellar basal body-associated protein FliL
MKYKFKSRLLNIFLILTLTLTMLTGMTIIASATPLDPGVASNKNEPQTSWSIEEIDNSSTWTYGWCCQMYADL